jgi:alkaline phosphatase D
VDRRRFLTASAAGAGGLLLAGCTPPSPSYPPQSGLAFEGVGPYPSGVGSGDPTPTSVLLWTRVHPERDGGAGVPVTVEVATTPSFADVVWSGGALATSLRDHCVTVDATGLEPATTYWYRFRYDATTSPIGRTRTAPVGGVDRLRVAAFSCQRWTHGYFTAHADLASLADDPETDVDLVLSLGDYVYETGFADRVYIPGREDPIQRAVTQDEFRSKYRMYRSDPDLQAMHAAYPVVHIFDNHDGLAQPGDPQAAGALAAFDEHVPVRRRLPGRIDRSLRWGDLAEVFVTDQRSFRSPTLPDATPLGTSTTDEPGMLDPARTMLGVDQRDWLVDGLTTSSARWKVVGSQLMFWPWRSVGRFPGQPRGSGVYFNTTQWDGYIAERHHILDALDAADTRDVVLFSGDSHFFSAAEVSSDVDLVGSTPRVLEFGTGSITSNNADENGYPSDESTVPFLNLSNSNHLRWFESDRHGYVLAEFTPGAVTAEARSPRTIRQPTSATDVLIRFRAARGAQRLERLPA